MFLDRSLDRFYNHHASPILPTKRKLVTGDLQRQIERTYRSNLNAVGEVDLARLAIRDCIMHIMNTPEDPAQYDTDRDRYILGIVPNLSVQETAFDPVLGGAYANRWFFTNNDTRSIVLPVSPEKIFEVYPLDGDWTGYRPLRYVSTDTSGLSFYLTAKGLDYKGSGPKVAFFTLDIGAAVLQYMYYQRTFGMGLDQYIHQCLILPCFTVDNANLWLMSQYSNWLGENDPVYTDTMFPTQLTYRPSGIDQLHAEVSRIADEYRHAASPPQRIVEGLPLVYENNPIKLYNRLRREAPVPPRENYYWAELLRVRPYLNLAIRSSALNMGFSENRNFFKTLYRDLYYARRNSFTTGITDPVVSSYIARLCEDLYLQVDSLYDQ